MSNSKKQDDLKQIVVYEMTQGVVRLCIKGTMPLIVNRVANKAKQELLLPRGRKTAADKASSLKHNPLEEYRSSPHLSRFSDKGPTRILMPSTAFKSAMRNAAIDVPGSASKAQVGRLSYVEGEYVNIFGVPKLHMTIVRNSDISRTPDVRTRAILAEWACILTIRYMKPALSDETMSRLMAAAGQTQGIGEWRTEKGKGDYGQFVICDKDDEDFVRICKEGGRVAQDEALKDPECYDPDTAELLEWFNEEVKRRPVGQARKQEVA